MTAFAPPRGRQPSIEWVPIGELRIDDSYQRSIDTAASRRLIAAIAADWDWDVLDVLKVSRRPDDSLFLVDGQHRRAAAEARGDIPQLPCVLKRCAGPAEEARLFTVANRGRKSMSHVDDFRAAVVAGDAAAVAIDAAVAAAGFTIARHSMAQRLGPGELSNVSALRSLLRRFGQDRFAAGLAVMGEAFPDEQLVSPTALLGAIILVAADPGRDPDALFATLLTGTTRDWFEWTDVPTGAGGVRTGALRDLLRARIADAPTSQRRVA